MSLPVQYFRAGVGSVIVNDDGLILAMERADVPGAWQLPQGGLEASEEPFRAALREVSEETGISERDLELLDSYPEPLVYELPASARSEKTGVAKFNIGSFSDSAEVIRQLMWRVAASSEPGSGCLFIAYCTWWRTSANPFIGG